MSYPQLFLILTAIISILALVDLSHATDKNGFLPSNTPSFSFHQFVSTPIPNVPDIKDEGSKDNIETYYSDTDTEDLTSDPEDLIEIDELIDTHQEKH